MNNPAVTLPAVTFIGPLVLSLFALPAAPAPVPGDAVRFAPELGVPLKKSIRIQHYLELVDFSTTRGDAAPRRVEQTGLINSELFVVVQDTYEEVVDGKPLSLLREFLEYGGKAEAMTFTDSTRGREKAQFGSPMKGRTVRFTWVEEEGKHARMYEKFNGPDYYLEEVHYDIDLLSALPDGEVSEGDTWTLDSDAARTLLNPGHSLHAWPGSSGSALTRNLNMGIAGDPGLLLTGEVVAHGTVTYQGTREVEGRTLQVLRVECELFSETDHVERYVDHKPATEAQLAPAIVESVDVGWTLLGKGEILWDPERAHFHSYGMDADQIINIRVHKTTGWDDQHPDGIPLVHEVVLEGALNFQLNLP